MAERTFHHFGVPVTDTQENETYLEGAKVSITDPDCHPYRVEYLRFDAGSPMHADVQNHAHAAFMVDDLDAALAGKDVIVPAFDATDTLRVAFINDAGAVIELMQQK